jgi:hypothetical protein
MASASHEGSVLDNEDGIFAVGWQTPPHVRRTRVVSSQFDRALAMVQEALTYKTVAYEVTRACIVKHV